MSGASVLIQQNFLQNFLPLAEQTSAATGIPVGDVLAQAALETGWGQAVPGNNYFGISPGGSLANYSSAGESFGAYSNLMNSPTYSGVAAAAANGPLAFGQALQTSGYNPSPNYGSSIEAVATQVNAMLAGIGVNGNEVASDASGAGAGAPSGSTSSSGGSGPAADGSTGSPSLAEDVATYLARATYLIVGVVLLAGALYLFGRRT